jgi:histidine ammonia-lyase
LILNNQYFDLQSFILMDDKHISLGPEMVERIERNHRFLLQKLSPEDAVYYGVNTGFGSLCNVKIPKSDLQQLQYNLVRSHACGTGSEVPREIVSLLFLLKIINLAQGYSGVRLALVEHMISVYNAGIRPKVYTQGSLGASGDLAPLAHLALCLIGEGEVYLKGNCLSSSEALREVGIAPIGLEAKEGLALLNGTQFSTAYALWAVMEASRQCEVADMVAALSLDVFLGSRDPFDHDLHRIRPHEGQIESAAAIRRWLQQSELKQEKPIAVQDPYSFRCVPQVHGATRDTVAYAASVVLKEVNAVTDNPSIFDDADKILSGGNFHAQPIALILDFLAIALSELSSISERRTFQLISGLRGLPPFLCAMPGLHSGFMIPQYTAASIVSQNKQLCTPASVDSIVSSAGQEDHVSMAANAATKAYQVVHNVWQVLGIEWMAACQGLNLRRPLVSSPALETKVEAFRKDVPFIQQDVIMYPYLHRAKAFLQELEF